MRMGFSTQGLDRISKRLAKLQNPDPMPLLERWEDIITEDNRTGVLSGLDGHGEPLEPTKYRGSLAKKTNFRRGVKMGVRVHPALITANDNLTTAEYKKLNGPPLAPRRERSRTIANFATEIIHTSESRWGVVGGWRNVISRHGISFLEAHFVGANTGRFRLPVRDLRGIRPESQRKIATTLSRWITFLLKGGSF